MVGVRVRVSISYLNRNFVVVLVNSFLAPSIESLCEMISPQSDRTWGKNFVICISYSFVV